MQTSRVQVHGQFTEIADAVDGAQVRIMLISRVSTGARQHNQIVSADNGTGVHETSLQVLGPAGHTVGGEPVKPIDAIVQEQPAA